MLNIFYSEPIKCKVKRFFQEKKMSFSFAKKNMGMIDRLIRAITGFAMIYIGFIDQAIIGNLTINIIVGVFGLISIIFAYIASCPIYFLGNISTIKKSSENG